MTIDPNDPVQFYLREVRGIQPLTPHEETELLRRVRAQDEHAESASRRLIEGNLALVVSIVDRHSSAGISMLDLIQEGNAGLFQALGTFTEDSGQSFSEHAAKCIEAAVLQAIDKLKQAPE